MDWDDFQEQAIYLMMFAMLGGALRGLARTFTQEGWLKPEERSILNAIFGSWYVKRAEIEAGERRFDRLIEIAANLYKTRSVRIGLLTPAEAERRASEMKEEARRKLAEIGVL